MNSEEVEANIRLGTSFENLPPTAKQVQKYVILTNDGRLSLLDFQVSAHYGRWFDLHYFP